MKKTWSSLCLFVFRLEDFHLEDSHLVKHSHCITVTSLVLWLRSDYWSDIVFHWSGRWRAPSMCLWRWLRTGSGTVRVSSGSASSAGEATEKWHHCSGDEGCIRGERRLRCQGESSVCLSVCLPVCLWQSVRNQSADASWSSVRKWSCVCFWDDSTESHCI